MNIEEIDKWLKEEEGISYTELGKEFNDAVELSSKCAKKSQEKDKEIERLNKLISQREKKWEKWTTEKTILSTKMSDYLCKYQNIKREYTKQIKISTDRKKEIERLNNIINELENTLLEWHKYWEDDDSYSWQYKNAYDYLQELKGSVSNE